MFVVKKRTRRGSVFQSSTKGGTSDPTCLARALPLLAPISPRRTVALNGTRVSVGTGKGKSPRGGRERGRDTSEERKREC